MLYLESYWIPSVVVGGIGIPLVFLVRRLEGPVPENIGGVSYILGWCVVGA